MALLPNAMGISAVSCSGAGDLGAPRMADSVSEHCWPTLYPARTFFAFSTGVFRATAANMGQNELHSSQQPSLAKGDLQHERRG